METKTFTHWRKGDDSNYLMSWDVEGEMKATIISVVRKDAEVRGKSKSCRVATFKEKLKPMIINATNGKVIENAIGSYHIENWKAIDLPVILFVDEAVKGFGKEVTRGLRIKVLNMPLLTPDKANAWKNAVEYYRINANYDAIETRFKLTDEIKTQIKSEADGLSN